MTFARNSLRNAGLAFVQIGLCLATAHAQDTQSTGTPKIIRKSDGMLQAPVVKRVQPAYPPLAKAAGVAGRVVVEVTVDEQGKVIAARAISGSPLLKDPAITAARGWTFEPTLLRDEPVKVIGTITFTFKLGDSKEAEAKQEESSQAIEVLKREIALNPNSAELYRQLGLSYWGDMEQQENAISAFKEAIRLDSNNPETYYSLGQSYDLLKRHDEALESYKEAVRIKPDFAYADRAYTFIGKIQLEKQNYQEALRAFKRGIEVDATWVDNYFYLGITYLRLGDKESAMNEYRSLRERDQPLADELLKRINKQP